MGIQGISSVPIQKPGASGVKDQNDVKNADQKEFEDSLDSVVLSDATGVKDQLALSPELKELLAHLAEVAEGESENQDPAGSLKGAEKLAMVTEASVTGLNPWSKEWVLEGISDEDREKIKPLINQINVKQPSSLDAEINTEQNIKAANSNVNLSQALPGAATQGVSGLSAIEAKLLEDLKKVNGEIEQIGANNNSLKGIKSHELGKSASKDMISFSGDDFINAKQVAHQVTPVSAKADLLDTAPQGTRTASQIDLTSAIKNLDPKLNSNAIQNIDPTLNAGSLAAHGAHSIQNGNDAGQFQAVMTGEVDGHVVKGAMARDRLSSESLTNLQSQIQLMKTNPGGGEIRLKLKPESLGELRVQVNTIGDNVHLKILASDSNAKGVLEESLGFLKESLSHSNISLTKVELGVAQNTHSAVSNNDDLLSRNQSFDQWNEQAQAHHENSSEESEYGKSTLRRAADIAATSGLSSVSGSAIKYARNQDGRINTLAF